MNKIIPRGDRIFMAVVGPSGSGKTELILRMLAGNTFYPKFEKILFLYREIQPLYTEIAQKITIIFKKYINLDFVKNIDNCLLIFDDSRKEVFNYKEFVNLATAVRHRNINVIYVKHNLYQQSKWSRTTDLNTKHIILFKSPRDIQQIDYLDKQLNLQQFSRNCYDLAKQETFDIYSWILILKRPTVYDIVQT